jgi:hypothetical protein
MAFDPHEFGKLQGYPVVGWWPSGTLDQQTVLDYYAALAELSDATTLHRYSDFSAIDEVSFGYRVLEQLVMVRNVKLSDHRRMMLILMSTTPLGYGMSRMYEALMETVEMDIHVCRTVTDAAAILEVPESSLARPQ